MTDESPDRGPAAATPPRRPNRLLDWGLAIGVLAATAAFSLWAPNGARTVGAWMGFAP